MEIKRCSTSDALVYTGEALVMLEMLVMLVMLVMPSDALAMPEQIKREHYPSALSCRASLRLHCSFSAPTPHPHSSQQSFIPNGNFTRAHCTPAESKSFLNSI